MSKSLKEIDSSTRLPMFGGYHHADLRPTTAYMLELNERQKSYENATIRIALCGPAESYWNETCIARRPVADAYVSSVTRVPNKVIASWPKHFVAAQKPAVLPIVATIPDLVGLLASITMLANGPVEDEHGRHQPSLKGLRDCFRVILELSEEGTLRRPTDTSVDVNGDLRLTWSYDGREVDLVFPFEESEPSYLYFSDDDTYGTEVDISSASISRQLRWIAGGPGENA